MAAIDIGIAYEPHHPHPDELTELSNALTELTNESPEKQIVHFYAGEISNEIVQLLLDAATWKNALLALATVLGGAFVTSFGSGLGKSAADDVWKNKKKYYDAVKQKTVAPFLRVVRAIAALRAKKQIVTIAVKIPDTARNAGLVITSDDPAEIAWQLANITRCSEEITKVISDAFQTNPQSTPGTGTNADSSIVIEVLGNGDVRVLGITIKK